MKVKAICTENVEYVAPNTSIKDVATKMEERDCGSILVGENNKLTGIITDRDIVLRCVSKGLNPDETTAEQCQTPDILYCVQDDEVEDVLRNMADNQVCRMVVLDNKEDKNLVGIVSFGDCSVACSKEDVSGEAARDIKKAA